MSHAPMSIEAVMDEERRMVLELLQNPPKPQKRASSVSAAVGRSASPYGSNPRSPVRPSMLDIVEGERSGSQSPRFRDSASTPGGSPARPVRSMLDIDGPPRAASVSSSTHDGTPLSTVLSAPTSPTDPIHKTSTATSSLSSSGATFHPRSMSDASLKPAAFGPRQYSDRVDHTAEYQFSDIITQKQGPTLNKGAQQSKQNATNKLTTTAMAELMRGADISNLRLPGQNLPLHGRQATASPKPRKRGSKSPGNRLAPRSDSPNVVLSGGRNLSPAGRAVLDEASGIDMANAYRKLSDANLARAGGSLSELPLHNRSRDGTPSRLAKTYLSPDGDELGSSDNESYSSDEDDGEERGRKTARTFSDGEHTSQSADGPAPKSLLAAADDERAQIAAKQPEYKYRSLLDEPEITITGPSGEKVKGKSGVRPQNNFMRSRSASVTNWDSEDEAEFNDIKSAQNLTVTMTPIMNYPEFQRSVRIIYRGEFAKVQKEAEEDEHRRVRKYLVATDLSAESAHALEWTVGTVLRDGDTLAAIYCVDEELGIPVPESGLAAMSSVPASTSRLPGLTSMTSVASSTRPNDVPATAPPSEPSTPVPGDQSKREEERQRAVQDITDRITRLLRKTRLQVRVTIEVLHCKNPRHLLTEVIDLVNPTMVILGSRGRSALKGVILGSFSNYLVTKSSVPVMVARKRLRKQNKLRRLPVQQVNNLSNPTARSLASARID